MAYKPQVLAVAEGGTGDATVTGILSGNGTAALVGRTITGTSNQISVSNGDGTGGNPTLSLTSNIQVSGISFDSGSNTLSAYASGTFTPTITGSGGNPTNAYTDQTGRYQKLGTKVIINGHVTLSSTSGGSGNVQLDALPFTSLNTANAVSAGSVEVGNVTFGTSVLYYGLTISINSTLGLVEGIKSAAAVLDLVVGGLSATSTFAYSANYNI